jgi:hypothetical protein
MIEKRRRQPHNIIIIRERTGHSIRFHPSHKIALEKKYLTIQLVMNGTVSAKKKKVRGVQNGWFTETETMWPGQRFSLALEVSYIHALRKSLPPTVLVT